MRFIHIAFLIITLSFSISANNVITLERAISLARENNLDLKRSTLELSELKRDKDTAYNVFFPTVEGYSYLTRSNTDPVSYSDINLTYSFEASFSFTPALFDAITLLKRNYELGEITYTQAVLSLEKEVKEVFYNIILLEEQIKLLEDNLKTMERRYDLTKLNYDAGLESELELLKVQVSYENFKPELNNLKNSYNTTLISFKHLLGLDLYGEVIIEGEINPSIVTLTLEEAYQMALNNNNDLNKILKYEDLFKAQRKTNFSQNFLPVVGISYTAETTLNDPFESDNFDLDNYSDDSGMFTLYLYYSFNALFPNSSERIALEKIDNSLLDLKLQQETLLDGIKLQLSNYLSILNNSIDIQEGLKLTVRLAQKNLDKVEQSYTAGTSKLIEVENAQNEYKKARLELLKEKYNYNSNKLKLEAIILPQ